MPASSTAAEIRDVNTRYHDVAAAWYDAKWGIDYGPVGRDQVLGKLRKALGPHPGPFPRALEIGAGTGYFALHLMREGVIERATCTDISPGMLAVLRANAVALELDVETVACDAEALPFADGSFDLVFGHAVLHHIPNLARAFGEFMRVLRPGGTLLFAGEPSRVGDRIAAVPKRAGLLAAPAWRALVGAAAATPRTGTANGYGSDSDSDSGGTDDGGCDAPVDHAAHCNAHELEGLVDVHAFVPAELAGLARGVGFERVRVLGEELLANWFGWVTRTLEATAEPSQVPRRWQLFAFRGYIALQAADRRLLEPRLPAAVFYNLMLAARRPAE